jgi:hypothetical protein
VVTAASGRRTSLSVANLRGLSRSGLIRIPLSRLKAKDRRRSRRFLAFFRCRWRRTVKGFDRSCTESSLLDGVQGRRRSAAGAESIPLSRRRTVKGFDPSWTECRDEDGAPQARSQSPVPDWRLPIQVAGHRGTAPPHLRRSATTLAFHPSPIKEVWLLLSSKAPPWPAEAQRVRLPRRKRRIQASAGCSAPPHPPRSSTGRPALRSRRWTDVACVGCCCWGVANESLVAKVSPWDGPCMSVTVVAKSTGEEFTTCPTRIVALLWWKHSVLDGASARTRHSWRQLSAIARRGEYWPRWRRLELVHSSG